MAHHFLPSGSKPIHYAIRVEPDLDNQRFKGSSTVTVAITEAVVSIKLNIHELEVQSTKLTDASGNILQIASTRIDRKAQTFKILLEHHVPPNTKLLLHQEFAGIIRRDGRGFHMPTEGSYMASTHMEPTFARAVFPCFDEPLFKATFSITMLVPINLTCLSNMPIKYVTETPSDSPTMKLVEFEESELMSTYLVAFAVGELDVMITSSYRIPIKAYTPKGYSIENCRYALDVAGISLGVLVKMLEVDYVLPKLDLLLVPGSIGGMENWGLITLAVEFMLSAPDNTAADKISLTQTIVHEICHQWFGNLVTMTSWNGCWLKEGLAEWAQLEVRNRMEGNLEPFLDFVADGLQTALVWDSKRFGHALESKVDGSGVSRPYFDEIAYKKGCAVLRMLSTTLGFKVFLDGIKMYLRLHAFGNATTDDLWNAMSHMSGLDVGAFMRPWTLEEGYPMLTIDGDQQQQCLNISQTRFQSITASGDEHKIWPIPLRISPSQTSTKEMLFTRTKSIKMPVDINVNVGQSRFYRIAYSPTQLSIVINNHFKGYQSVEDRIGILSNVSALVFSDHNPAIRIPILLDMLQNFEDEENYFVWRVVISTLNELRTCLLFEKKLRHSFDNFSKSLVRKCLYRKSKFSLDDDLNEQSFKALMFGNSGGDENVYDAALMMFEQFVNREPKVLNPNLRLKVFRIVLDRGGKKEVCF